MRALAVVVALGLTWSSATARAEDERKQDMGARLGLELGSRVTPGGGHLVGTYLYRLTEDDWLDQSVAFTFGGQGAGCFRDREGELLCDHGPLSGFAAQVAVGIRRYLRGQGDFTPYVRAGVAVRGAFYSSDELSGLAVPIFGGGGVRVKVAARVHLLADGVLSTGFALFDRGLGVEPHAALTVSAGVELRID